MANYYKMDFEETSALTGENVNKVFYTLAKKALEKKEIKPKFNNAVNMSPTVKLSVVDPKYSEKY